MQRPHTTNATRVLRRMVYKTAIRKHPMQPQMVNSRNQNPLMKCRATALTLGALLAAWMSLFSAAPALAQTSDPAVSQPGPQAVPGFWDPRRRPDRPDLSRITVIRFLTETDYPPFNFAGPDGNPAGFNVDLARLICEEIKAVAAKVQCTIQMR